MAHRVEPQRITPPLSPGRRASLAVLRLAIVMGDDGPPSEFRIFAAGENNTSKGPVIFDAAAASAVMAAAADQGNELMLDYLHASVEGKSFDPAHAGKAAGWFKLEVRNGELWAVDVRWTLSAALMLKAAEYRYFSPCVRTDKHGRALELVNIALTNLPAMKHLEPLMAAQRAFEDLPDEKEPQTMAEDKPQIDTAAITKACEDCAASCTACAEAMGGGDVGAAMSATQACIESCKQCIEACGAMGGGARASEPAPSPEMEMAATKLMKLASKGTLSETLSEIESWRESHLKLEAENKRLADERAVLETSERRRLVGELVKLGVEVPAAGHPAGAWADEAGTIPCARLQAEPLATLRARVTALQAVRPGSTPTPPSKIDATPPSAGSDLTPEQRQICLETGVKPEDYAKTLAQHGRKR